MFGRRREYENNNYCEGVCNNDDKNCYCPMNSLRDINSKEFIEEWRENVLKMFKHVDYFITTSNFVKKLFLSIYSERSIINEDNFEVIEHGRDFPRLKKDYFEIPSKNKYKIIPELSTSPSFERMYGQ